MDKTKKLTILFIGDIFGKNGINKAIESIKILKSKYKIDFVIAQAENVSGRKGLLPKDYLKLKQNGVDAFTLGNHVWAKEQINEIIENEDLIRPYNCISSYPGKGSRVFNINEITLRVSSFLGITFNKLLPPWKEESAANFFDAFDSLKENELECDFHIIDFHAETTSEKNVFGIYAAKSDFVDAFIGTHTHVQTNDEKFLLNKMLYISDAGMCGPKDAAIGANFDEVYRKMRYQEQISFKPSNNECQFNGVLLFLEKNDNKRNYKIEKIKF